MTLPPLADVAVLEALADGLSDNMRALLSESGTDWFAAASLTWRSPAATGSALTKMADRGLLERRSDDISIDRAVGRDSK